MLQKYMSCLKMLTLVEFMKRVVNRINRHMPVVCV